VCIYTYIIQNRKLVSDLIFLKRCRANGILPKYVQINYPSTNKRAKIVLKHAEEKLLCNEIKKIRRKLSFIDEDLNKLTTILDNTLNKETREKLSEMIKNQTQKTFQGKIDKLKTKFEKLSQDQNNTTTKRQIKLTKKSAVVNMTDQIFTKHEINILEKGFNYALTPKNILKEDIISSIENSLYKLQDHEKEIIRQESCKILRVATAPKPNVTIH